MTVRQLEARVARLEQQVAELKGHHGQKKDGWRALIGIGTDDPIMKEAMAYALKYRERDRAKARRQRAKKKQKQ